MKRFIFSVLFVSVFCIGLGALVEKTSAKFKSDEKALALIRQARQVIGGDNSLVAVRSLTIVGQTTRTFKADGAERTEQGETEINVQLPDKMMKMVKMGSHDGDAAGGEKTFNKQIDVVVVGNDKDGQKFIVKGNGNGEGVGTGAGAGDNVKKVIVRKSDGTTEVFNGAEAGTVSDAHAGGIIVRKVDGDKTVFTTKDGKTVNVDGADNVMLHRAGGGEGHAATGHNELLRLTLGLLLTAPEGMDVDYQMGGEVDVDGTACNIVVAKLGESSFKLFLGKSSNLPLMISYKASREPQLFTFRTKAPDGSENTNESNHVFTRKVAGPPVESEEFNVRFSDYRSVGGVQLPFKWTQTVGGAADETFDVTSYEINPANIADKFNNQNVKVRMMKKPDGQ